MRILFYLIVAIGFSSANAGSYEDFFRAVIADNPRQIVRLVERGFDPNARDPDGQPALIRALRAESYEAAMALARLPGTDVEVANASGETPLMMAALKDQPALARLLIERGARIEKPGWTPLHYAAAGNSLAVLELLLARGAPLDTPAPNGRTPLMMAALYAGETLVDRLLDAGADPKLLDLGNRSAADLATFGDREWLGAKIAARAARTMPR